MLMNLIEPPDMTNVSKSFDVLYDVGMISSPDDEGLLTETGKMAGSLPVDLYLSRMIAYGWMHRLLSGSLINTPFRHISGSRHRGVRHRGGSLAAEDFVSDR